MESTSITYWGTILFDPPNETNKHNKQKGWKRTAMVMLDGRQQVTDYYSWFIAKRYGFPLVRSLRGAHISFLNDHIRDIGGDSRAESEALWKEVKNKYNGKRIGVKVSLDVATDGAYWWLPMAEEDRAELQKIRSELGLGLPFFDMHMTIGSPNEHNRITSDYFHNLLAKGVCR
mgnify:CR=1 FL=1|jgi:hypothetical protein|tara:strand:+ start:9112 stop:9633 length:522 start_codon:yes stop_codon:yes gene_type:complete